MKPDLDKLKIETAYLKAVGRNTFRPGELAEILGVVTVTPPSATPRVCFKLQYADGIIDYTPLSDIDLYEVICKGKERLSLTEKE